MNTPEHFQPPPDLELEDGISIAEYLAVLLDEWRILVFPFFLAILAACLYLLSAVPTYSASGVIQVSSSDSAGTDALLDLAGARPSPVETEVEILHSRRIVGKALKKLSLNIVQDTPSITLDPQISLGGKSPTSPDLMSLRKLIVDLSVADWVEKPVKAVFSKAENGGIRMRLGEGAALTHVAAGGELEQKGVSFKVAEGQNLSFSDNIEVTLLPEDMAAEKTFDKLQVESIGGGRKDTNLVRVAFESSDRTIARDMVNAIMETYMSFALDWRTLRADRSATFIEKQLEATRAALAESEGELQTFVERHGAVLLPEQAKEMIHSGANLELELRKVKIQEELLGMVVSDLTRAERSGKPSSLTGDFLFDDELLGRAIGALNELKMKRETLLSEVTEAHPEVSRLTNEIGRIRTQVRELITASRGRISDRRRAISRSLGTLHQDLSSFPDKERQMAVLRRNQEVSQDMYKFLMTKLEESRILKASTTIDKRIIDRATTPFSHSRPKRTTILILAAFLGILLGIGAVFARRAIDPRVRDEEEAKNLAGLPIYGAIPDLPGIGISLKDNQTPEPIWESPKGPAAEAFRTLRTNVEFAQVGEESLKVLQVTSSEASEGKSTIIANLAVALSKAGHNVLIVDLDLRRPSQHKTWEAPRTPGISDHLVGQTDLMIRNIAKYKLDFIPAGNEPPESQRLLSSKRLAELIGEWRARYDYILLDTPPLLVADSLVISRMSDLLLFVARPRHCRRSNVKLAHAAHERVDLVKGLIINGVSTRRGGYYHYYRGSYYGSKTSDTQES